MPKKATGKSGLSEAIPRQSPDTPGVPKSGSTMGDGVPDREPVPDVGTIGIALRALPQSKFVPLSDAASFAFLGGPPVFVPPDGVTEKELGRGFQFVRSDGTYCVRLADSSGRDRVLVGPAEFELAALGAILYDLPSDWRTETAARQEAFCKALGAAAADGKVTFRGRKVPFARIDEDEGEISAEIPIGYFDQEREFTPQENVIWANDKVEGHLLVPTTDPAWKAVVVNREEFLLFLDEHYPAVRGKAGQNRMRSVKAKRDDAARLAEVIRQRPDLTRADAATMLAYEERSRVLDEIWKAAWDMAGLKPPRGRRKKGAPSEAAD